MRRTGVFLIVVVLAAVAGCSQQSSPASPTPAQKAAAQKTQAEANEAAAQKKFKLYHEMLAMNRPVLAVRIGKEILAKYPHTQVAAKMAKVLPAVSAKAKAHATQIRLANLWLYQVSPMAGGTQSTATIHPSKPADTQVQLVLRRQTKWGESAFLYDHAKGGGFVCHRLCDVVMHFDGAKHVYKGYLPKGGAPAMFIKDDKGFIKRMTQAQKVDMTVTLKGKGKQTLVFETGGFSASKWQPLPGK